VLPSTATGFHSSKIRAPSPLRLSAQARLLGPVMPCMKLGYPEIYWLISIFPWVSPIWQQTQISYFWLYIYIKASQSDTWLLALLSPHSFSILCLSVFVQLLSSGLPWIGHSVTCAQPQTSVHSWSELPGHPRLELASITHRPVNGRVYTLLVTPGGYPQKEAAHSPA